MSKRRPPDPDEALRHVLAALTSYTLEARRTTFTALMCAVAQYGQACRHVERRRILAELAARARETAEPEPPFTLEFAEET